MAASVVIIIQLNKIPLVSKGLKTNS